MRYLRVLAGCAVAFLLQGCPGRGCTTIVNETGEPLTVRYGDEVSVPAGASGRSCGYTLAETFIIDTPRATWHYDNQFVGQDFMYPTFDVVLQVRRDGRIYARQPPQATRKFAGQPPGYPLRPKT